MIHTKRLSLVPVDYEYSEDLLEIWKDFEVVKYTYLAQIQNIDECNKRIEMLLSHTNTDFINNFIVVHEGRAIGVAGFPVIKDGGSFECGFYYHYGRKYWGNGYGTEAGRALQEYIFNRYPDAVIRADAVSVNNASIEVLKKIGFRQTFVEEAGFQNNGYQLDLVHFVSDRSMPSSIS